jgi:hypothetical protein
MMMAYFSNGSDQSYYENMYCNRCVHDVGCRVFGLHLEWNYEAVGEDADLTKKEALDTLWPRDGLHNGACAMFFEKEGVNHEDQ